MAKQLPQNAILHFPRWYRDNRLFTGLITQPAFIAYMFGNPSLFDNKALRITALRIFNTIGRYFYSVTIVTATVMAIERWFYMSRRSFITVRRAYFIFATIILALVPFSMLRLWLVPQEYIGDFFDLFTMGSLSVICLAITSFSYFKVFCIIKRQQLQVVAINQASQNLGQPAAINLTKYRKSVSTILYILLLFWGTFLPQAICVSIVFFSNNRADTKMAYSIFHVAATLCFLSSALNPLLYNWRLKDVKIQKFFRSRWSMIVRVGVVLSSTFVNGLIVKRQRQPRRRLRKRHLKVNSRYFNLYRAYSIWFSSSNVGNFFWS